MVYGSADHLSKGVDVFVKRELFQNLDSWVSYSLSKTTIAFNDLEKITYIAPYDQTHNLNLGVSFATEKFSLGAVWRFASGLYARSFYMNRAQTSFERMAPPDVVANENPFTSLPNRFDPIHSLNISASYKLLKTEKRPFKATFGVSLLNVYNQNNLTDIVVRSGRNLQPRDAMSFAPNLMVMIEF